MKQFRYKRFFLFLVVLIIPSIVIGLLGWRNAAQQRELDAKGQVDEERNTKDKAKVQIREQLLALLEKIKSDESAAAGRSSAARSAAYSHPAVQLVGQADGGRLILPWEVNPNAARFVASIKEEEFALRILEAGRFENVEPVDYASAESIYSRLISSAEESGKPAQAAYARVRLARTLRKAGKSSQALAVYRQLLNLPSTDIDDDGLPYTLMAATVLSEMHNADREVLDRMALEANSGTALAINQKFLLGVVLEALKNSGDASVKSDAARVLQQLSMRDAYVEQALALQSSFPTLHMTVSDWQTYGKDMWLVSMTAPKADANPLVIAVRAEDVFKEIVSRSDSDVRFAISAADAAGDPLGENLPGLRVTFRPAGAADHPARLDAQISPYLFALPPVVALALLGGYLLWRDTRRESRMAEMRSQFVSSVSHELKTPLTSIRMFAETLQMNDATPSETRAEYLDTIVNETERLTRLLNNVLDFSRIERGQRNYHMQPTALDAVVHSALRTMQFPLTQQGFHLQVDICEGLPPVHADRDAIEQAILNLLSNAMKYSGKNRDIEVQLCSKDGSALIQVTDHGIGIPQEELKRVFQRFYRIATPENRAISGTGLGLSLVAHIAEAHGGSVEVASKPGEGSTFSLRLPLNGSHPS